jgi:hypothetical protein
VLRIGSESLFLPFYFIVINLMIVSKLLSGRCRCLVDLHISKMCLERVLSPYFGIEVTFIALVITSKGLSVKCMCLAYFERSKMCLEKGFESLLWC